MHLLIDVDGVLADQVPPVLRALNRRFGLKVRKREITKWDQSVGPTDIKTEIEAFVLDPASAMSLPIVRGARKALFRLASERHHITIATSRAQPADAATREWLYRKQIPFHRYVNTSIHGKGALSGDVLVDDYPGNVLAFAAKGRIAILFSQPWNLGDPEVKAAIRNGLVFRARGWREVVDLIKAIQRKKGSKARGRPQESRGSKLYARPHVRTLPNGDSPSTSHS